MDGHLKHRNIYRIYEMYKFPALGIYYKLLVLVENGQKLSIGQLRYNACWLETK